MRSLLALSSTSLLACTASSSMTDMGPPPAGAEATALVLRGGLPAANVTVAFHDADGAVVAVVATAADGRASAAIAEGGMITVPVERGGTGGELDTVTGVAPGETITFGLPANLVAGNEIGKIRVESTPVLNTPAYTLDAGCHARDVASVSPAPEIGIGAACVTAAGTASVLMVSRTQDGLPYSWASGTDVRVSSNGTANVVLSPWSAEFEGVNVISRNIPDGSIGLLGAAAAVHDDVPFRALAVANEVTAYPGATSSFILGYPKYGEGFEYRVELVFGVDQDVTGKSVIVARVSGTPANVDLDAASAYLPAITKATLVTGVAGATASWDGDASQAGDAALVRFAATSASGSLRWNVLAASDAAAITLPNLPDELAALRPTMISSADIFVVDDDRLSGFAAARTGVGTAILDRPLSGPAARVRFAVTRATP